MLCPPKYLISGPCDLAALSYFQRNDPVTDEALNLRPSANLMPVFADSIKEGQGKRIESKQQ
jgi:hypothetical protein